MNWLSQIQITAIGFRHGLDFPSFNSLPNNKILDQSKVKDFADNKINVTRNLNFVLAWVKNISGKGENAGYLHFVLFPQWFQKLSFLGSLKVGIV